MARIPSKRWVEMVKRKEWTCEGWGVVTSDDAATLLSRQHASFVRLVKKARQRVLDTVPVGSEQIAEHIGYIGACDDILAAWQQGGKK